MKDGDGMAERKSNPCRAPTPTQLVPGPPPPCSWPAPAAAAAPPPRCSAATPAPPREGAQSPPLLRRLRGENQLRHGWGKRRGPRSPESGLPLGVGGGLRAGFVRPPEALPAQEQKPARREGPSLGASEPTSQVPTLHAWGLAQSPGDTGPSSLVPQSSRVSNICRAGGELYGRTSWALGEEQHLHPQAPTSAWVRLTQGVPGRSKGRQEQRMGRGNGRGAAA